MKFVSKLLLIILFVPFCLAAILTATVKFQLLYPNFWNETLTKNNVYTNLSKTLKTYAENQIVKEGGTRGEFNTITDIITPDILQDFISKNLNNILGFANGQRKELLVYLPLSQLPKQFVPKSIGLSSEELPLTAFLSKFHIAVGQDLPISQIAYIGMTTTYSFIGLLILSLLCFFSLFFLTESGKRIVAPGLALIISGIILLGLTVFGFIIKTSMLTDWVKGAEPSQIILSTFAPHILQEILKVWTIVGSALLVLGVVLLFVRRPVSNKAP